MSFPAADGWLPLDDGTFVADLGAVHQRETEGECELGLVVGGHLRNRSGLLHGGVLMTLIDRAGGIPAGRVAGDARIATASLTVNFLRPVPADARLIVRGRLRRAGRKTFFTDCEAFVDALLVATATAIYMLVGERMAQ